MLQSYELSESNTPQTAIQTNTAVVGAGAAELAVGACLQHVGIPFMMLEQAD
jgi:cation diffusion facilitator CzcD-associated flavoprotein CzcO